jgi:hypothetical protein
LLSISKKADWSDIRDDDRPCGIRPMLKRIGPASDFETVLEL